MTGSEVKIDELASLVDLTNPDLDPTGIREGYGEGVEPQILLKSSIRNTGIIYLTENSGDPADMTFELEPGEMITLDLSHYVKAKNIFYATGSGGDTLSIIVR